MTDREPHIYTGKPMIREIQVWQNGKRVTVRIKSADTRTAENLARAIENSPYDTQGGHAS